MKRWLFFGYGLASYVLFFGVYAYMAAFVGGFVRAKDDRYAERRVDGHCGGDQSVLLLVLFGLQHSVMARPGFKRVWTRIVPQPIERSTYVLASSAVLVLLMWAWRGIDVVVWDVQQPVLRGVAWATVCRGLAARAGREPA